MCVHVLRTRYWKFSQFLYNSRGTVNKRAFLLRTLRKSDYRIDTAARGARRFNVKVKSRLIKGFSLGYNSVCFFCAARPPPTQEGHSIRLLQQRTCNSRARFSSCARTIFTVSCACATVARSASKVFSEQIFSGESISS